MAISIYIFNSIILLKSSMWKSWYIFSIPWINWINVATVITYSVIPLRFNSVFQMLSHHVIFVCLNQPGLGSTLASNSRWGLSRLRLAGSPVLCSAMVSSCTLWANDAGVCSWKTNSHIPFIHYWNIILLLAFEAQEILRWLLYLVNDGLHMRLMRLVSIQQRRPLIGGDAEASLHCDLNNLRVVLPPKCLICAKLLFQLH